MKKIFLRATTAFVFLTSVGAMAWWVPAPPSILWRTFKMTFQVDGYREGNFVECIGGVISGGTNDVGFTATATTETNRGSSYIAATVKLYMNGGFIGRDDQAYAVGPRSSIIAKYKDTTRCFGNVKAFYISPKAEGYHKAKPMPKDPDYDLGSKDALSAAYPF